MVDLGSGTQLTGISRAEGPKRTELVSKAVWVYSLRVNENEKVHTASDYGQGSVKKIKTLIASHPNLFVVFISLLILIAIVAMETWAPI